MNSLLRLAPGTRRGYQVAALVAAAPTLALLTLFTVGETVGGDLSGLSHLLQLVPLVAVLAAGWRYPRAAGLLLVAVGLALALAFPWFARDAGLSVPVALLAEGLFLLPAVAAGLLLMRASRSPA